MKKFSAILLICVTAFALSAGEAAAAKVIIHNTYDNIIAVSILYLDTSSNRWTAEGWWTVDSNDSTTLNLTKAKDSKIFYCARYGGRNYIDKSTLGRESVNRWVSEGVFEYDDTAKPMNAENPHVVPFYSARYSSNSKAFVVRIDDRLEVKKSK